MTSTWDPAKSVRVAFKAPGKRDGAEFVPIVMIVGKSAESEKVPEPVMLQF